uniref:Uncharacterized protein n=1 Tax=Panagrolaimus superbus TaxID=310955 RepID=A0A914Z5Q3_9BILA
MQKKHRSLDGAQFMREFDQATRHAATHYPEYYQYDNYVNNQIYDPPPPLQQQQQPAFYSPQGTAAAMGRGYDMNDPLTVNVPSSSATGYYQPQQRGETAALQREYNALNKKLNYVMNSIRTFWSPELKKERQLRQDETIRLNSLQNKICQQAAELQVIQNELEKREKDINQLLSESELLDMEEELRRLRRQLHEPRNFTEKSVSVHELQTLKTKMERSEMTLSEKMRELASAEMRAKCAEEQNAELEKRVEILTRSNTAHEAQLQLLQDDLGVLRQKLESRNQQIESKEN